MGALGAVRGGSTLARIVAGIPGRWLRSLRVELDSTLARCSVSTVAGRDHRQTRKGSAWGWCVLALIMGCPAPPASNDTRKEETTGAAKAVAAPQPPLPGIQSPSAALATTLGAKVATMGADYEPRTSHRTAEGGPKYTNRLIFETSPYLLQHAHNPVNWYSWGEEAFARAIEEDKPVLMSVGYSTCHWCHVMERESFEDEEIAAYLNEHFVAIKVDREERPDVDDVYMSAVQSMTGRGGWPMTVIMTPDKLPFFAGTYVPARDGDRGSRRGFLTILKQMKAAWSSQSEDVLQESQRVSMAIARANTGAPSPEIPGTDVIVRSGRSVVSRLDREWGGFGRAPKFPRPANLRFLLRYGRRAGDEEAIRATHLTLQRMSEGGVHDHIGGGFHRYSVDKEWLVPHFEKMLYDNAQLVVVLLETAQATGDESLREVAADTLDYLEKEMSSPAGGFFSATDADSLNPLTKEEEEGWFFTWTERELDTVLGVDLSKVFRTRYETSRRGNFERRNILHTRRSDDVIAKELGLTTTALRDKLKEGRAILYTHRASRPAPLRDDKVIAAWNGLALSAFAKAGFVLNRPDYVARAKTVATFLLNEMRRPDGRLFRTYRDGTPANFAVLEDYAFVIQGLLDLSEADGDPRWILEALSLQEVLERHYMDPKGGYYASADDGEVLLVRPKPDYDGAEPSGNSVAALNLLRLHELTGEDRFRVAADAVFKAQSTALLRRSAAVPALLSSLDFRTDRAFEVFVVGEEEARAALEEVVRETFLPNRVLVRWRESDEARIAKVIPAVEGKRTREGKPTAYVCERGICQAPTSDPSKLRTQLAEIKAYDGR